MIRRADHYAGVAALPSRSATALCPPPIQTMTHAFVAASATRGTSASEKLPGRVFDEAHHVGRAEAGEIAAARSCATADASSNPQTITRIAVRRSDRHGSLVIVFDADFVGTSVFPAKGDAILRVDPRTVCG